MKIEKYEVSKLDRKSGHDIHFNWIKILRNVLTTLPIYVPFIFFVGISPWLMTIPTFIMLTTLAFQIFVPYKRAKKYDSFYKRLDDKVENFNSKVGKMLPHRTIENFQFWEEGDFIRIFYFDGDTPDELPMPFKIMMDFKYIGVSDDHMILGKHGTIVKKINPAIFEHFPYTNDSANRRFNKELEKQAKNEARNSSYHEYMEAYQTELEKQKQMVV